jgi:hypothetical protein
MNWEGILAITACVGLVITIIGFVFALGKLVARFEALEGRVCEDRDSNSKQHAEFYVTVRNVEGIKVELLNLAKSFDEMRVDIREILARLPKAKAS